MGCVSAAEVLPSCIKSILYRQRHIPEQNRKEYKLYHVSRLFAPDIFSYMRVLLVYCTIYYIIRNYSYIHYMCII